MPKKRTRQQKIRAQYHYAMPVGRSFTGVTETTNGEEKTGMPIKKQADVLSLYSYDPRFIVQDIRWTIIASLAILSIQLGLYFWLR